MTKGPAPIVTAAGGDVSKPFYRAPALAGEYRRSGGQPLSALEIAAAAPGVDADLAATVLGRYEHRLARALAGVINIVDPDVIVLGGGLSNIARLYDSVPRLWQEFVFSDTVTTPLVANRHGDSSGV